MAVDHSASITGSIAAVRPASDFETNKQKNGRNITMHGDPHLTTPIPASREKRRSCMRDLLQPALADATMVLVNGPPVWEKYAA
jgi:hypothetical protein